MELRTKTKIGLALIFAVSPALASGGTVFTVQHEHFHGSGSGSLEISDASISFREDGKHPEHSHRWNFEDIQQLTLTDTDLKVLTYEDQKWKFGRDREYLFKRLPPDLPGKAYQVFRRLDQRFVAKIAESPANVAWEIPAKLLNRIAGTQGVLLVGENVITYRTLSRNGSRTWSYADIANLSSTGRFDLTITTFERSGALRGTPTEYHFQLKDPLSDHRYDTLWRKLHNASGLAVLMPVESSR
jgi:hypothetical protein